MGESVIQGEGAGPEATTSALISRSISSILRGNIKFPFGISDKERKKIKFDEIKNKKFSAYLRINVKDKQGVLSDITKILSKNKISIKRLIQKPFKSKKYSSIVLITNESRDYALKKAIKIFNKKKYTIQKSKIIRIENI